MTTNARSGGVENEVLRADEERYRAMIANDIATLDRLLSEDLLYTHSLGYVDTKQAYLASLRAGQVKYLNVQRDSVTTRVHGDAAYMSGIVVIKVLVGGEAKVLTNRFLNVWVRTAGVWQLAAWASTPIPAEKS